MMLDDCMLCYVDSISLRLPRRSNHIIVASHRMFTPTSSLLG